MLQNRLKMTEVKDVHIAGFIRARKSGHFQMFEDSQEKSGNFFET